MFAREGVPRLSGAASFEDSLEAYRVARKANLRLLRRIAEADLGKGGFHPELKRALTVAEIRDPANNNNGKFSPSKKVSVTGFVAGVEPGGMPETCNCTSKKPGGRTDLRDVHINIVADPSEAADQTKYVIVEFTPRWEKTFGFDDSIYEAMRQLIESQIKGKRVKFSGWMLYDFIHANASQSTRPNQPVCAHFGDKNCNWRATPWEVHPVTAYEIVSGP